MRLRSFVADRVARQSLDREVVLDVGDERAGDPGPTARCPGTSESGRDSGLAMDSEPCGPCSTAIGIPTPKAPAPGSASVGSVRGIIPGGRSISQSRPTSS